MTEGNFYYIKNSFFDALPDCGLMLNKGEDGSHGRPCHYCFEFEGGYWMIPISSRIEKYQMIYDRKIQKSGRCDTIRFGYVNGKKRAFLIQNMFPVTQEYIAGPYLLQNGTVYARVNDDFSKELDALARKVIRLFKRGVKITFTDLDAILDFLDL